MTRKKGLCSALAIMNEERDRGSERAMKKLGLRVGRVELDKGWELLFQGAEARIFHGNMDGRPAIAKQRFTKRYRQQVLDQQLSRERLRAEMRSNIKCHGAGVACPEVLLVDIEKRVVVMEFIRGESLRQRFEKLQMQEDAEPHMLHLANCFGKLAGKLHAAGIVHGDLTTSNILLRDANSEGEEELVLIDFGLSSSDRVGDEERAVDLYVLERSLTSTHPNMEPLLSHVLEAYATLLAPETAKTTLKKLEDVRQRGRKRTMLG
ncbi:hypothetical protein B566_EDAN009904 [Ephemera danica]|nr:hypothetical protein B566_EDAN009904 [Ephemera danica]